MGLRSMRHMGLRVESQRLRRHSDGTVAVVLTATVAPWRQALEAARYRALPIPLRIWIAARILAHRIRLEGAC